MRVMEYVMHNVEKGPFAFSSGSGLRAREKDLSAL